MSNLYISSQEAAKINTDNPTNLRLQVGSKLKTALDYILGIGKRYYLDPSNGNDGNNGLSPESAFKTLSYAYSKLTANQHDTLYYISGPSSISLSAQFSWAKNYTHFVGIGAPSFTAQRARIFQAATATGLSPLINFTATGCIWSNIYVFQGVNDATSKLLMTMSGGRNYFDNVHLFGIGNATQSVAGSADLKLDGAEECRFVDCQFGGDTITRDANPNNILFDSAVSRILFERCKFPAYISAAGYSQIKVNDGTAIDRSIEFIKCRFTANSLNRGVTQTSVMNLPAGIVQGMILLEDTFAMSDGGAVDWDSNNRGLIWNNSVAAAASAAGGIMTNQ